MSCASRSSPRLSGMLAGKKDEMTACGYSVHHPSLQLAANELGDCQEGKPLDFHDRAGVQKPRTGFSSGQNLDLRGRVPLVGNERQG